jgi:hypothetical protein
MSDRSGASDGKTSARPGTCATNAVIAAPIRATTVKRARGPGQVANDLQQRGLLGLVTCVRWGMAGHEVSRWRRADRGERARREQVGLAATEMIARHRPADHSGEDPAHGGCGTGPAFSTALSPRPNWTSVRASPRLIRAHGTRLEDQDAKRWRRDEDPAVALLIGACRD